MSLTPQPKAAALPTRQWLPEHTYTTDDGWTITEAPEVAAAWVATLAAAERREEEAA